MRTLRCSAARHVVLVVLLAAVGVGGCKRGPEGAPAGGAPSTSGSECSLAEGRGGSSPAAGNRDYPVVKIDTSLGAIVVKLDGRKAILTVNNFLRCANAGYYDGTIFHDVSPGYAVIGGLYTSDLEKKPSRPPVRNEAPNGLANVRGTIAMAREPGVIDSATSGFFINLAKNSHLDHRDESAAGYGYCVFGKVIKGMDVADRIGSVATHEVAAKDGPPFQRVPVEPVVIRSIRVVQ